MASLVAIRTGLKTALSTISGLTAYEVVPDSGIFPAALVGGPNVIEYDYTMARYTDRWEIPIRVLVGRVDEASGQAVLDAYFASSGSGSVKAAVEADLTLGGAANTCRVIRAENYGVYQIWGAASIGMDAIVEVIA